MSAIALKYGAFDLQTDKITTTDTDIYSPPKNNVQADKLAGADGAVIVKTNFEPKTFTVAGRIRGSTREETEKLIDAFNTAMMQPNQAFDIARSGDIRRYVSTAQGIIISTSGHNTAGFSVDFMCPTGVASDTYNTALLSPSNVATSTASLGVTVGGTYQAEPVIKLKINTLTGGAAKRITVTNGSTMRGVSVTRNWIAGDTIEIDCLRKTVFVNSVPTDYLGQFPVWVVGPGVIAYSDDFTARDVTIESIYVRRWL